MLYHTTAIHGFYNAKETTTKASRKKVYKSRLSYKSQWESTYPWEYCTKVEDDMFCRLWQAYSKPQPTAHGSWTTRGAVGQHKKL